MTPTFSILTRLGGLKLNQEIPIEIDREAITRDCENAVSNFQAAPHFSRYHAGKWKAIGLITSGGEVGEDRPAAMTRKPYLPTPALDYCPYIRTLLDRLPARKNRVRFLSLEPGGVISWHSDGMDSIDYSGSARFHIPIVTSPKIEFRICHNLCKWIPGRMYYGDFSFPHSVRNHWDRSRVHLVIDLAPNEELRALFSRSFLEEKPKRTLFRKLCWKLLKIYKRRPRTR